MTNDPELRREVREVIASTLLVDEEDLPEEASPETCERWTSLYHMALLVNLEERFGVSLSMEEMMEMTSESAIVAALAEKLVGAA